MESNNLSLAEKEFALTKQILEALVTANEELRHKNALLVSFIQSKYDTYSPEEKEKLAPLLSYALTEKWNDITEQSYAVSEKGNGSPELSYAVTENVKGTTESSYVVTEKGKGSPEFSYSFAEKYKGTTTNTYAFAEKVNASPQVSYVVPEKGNDAKLSSFAINQTIKALDKRKRKRSASSAESELLLHIYKGGNCGYPTLKRVCDLSTSGIGKMLMRLRKRGLITRTGLQKLALTPSALHLLGKSVGH